MIEKKGRGEFLGQVRVFNVYIQSKLLMIETRKGVFRSGHVRSECLTCTFRASC